VTAAFGYADAEVERLLEKAVAAKSVSAAGRPRRALHAPVVHTTAALTAVGWLLAGASAHDAIVTAIAVLIITCPCALALAIPAVQVVASATMFRAGIILNAGDAIERLAEIDTVVFDKTGTLTLPDPTQNASGSRPGLAAARLALSAIIRSAVRSPRRRNRTPFDSAIEVPGQGAARW
jgi:Cu2+-exporting ATPase